MEMYYKNKECSFRNISTQNCPTRVTKRMLLLDARAPFFPRLGSQFFSTKIDKKTFWNFLKIERRETESVDPMGMFS